MRFYGVASAQVLEVIEFFNSREPAEQALCAIIHDEPELEPDLVLAALDLGGDAPAWFEVPARSRL